MPVRNHLGGTPRLKAQTLVGFAIMVAVVLALPVGAAAGAGEQPGRHAPDAPAFSNVSYFSSVDGFPLSYSEWLPVGYSNATAAPLVVYLHGIGDTTNWVPGGTNKWIAVLNASTPDGRTERGLIQNASANGYIFTVLNTRSPSGYFANTKCGGPQEQDVLDAIVHEKALRNVSSVYLIGFSMGSMGAFAIAATHPGLVAGIATAGTMSDFFEEYGYLNGNATRLPRSGPLYEANYDNCGVAPSAMAPASVTAFYEYLSAGRLASQNFSSIAVWSSSGGRDTVAPNALSTWYYEQGTNVFSTPTCAYEPRYGEPRGCTTTWSAWQAANPGRYDYDFVYEPLGTHDMDQLQPAAIFAFW